MQCHTHIPSLGFLFFLNSTLISCEVSYSLLMRPLVRQMSGISCAASGVPWRRFGNPFNSISPHMKQLCSGALFSLYCSEQVQTSIPSQTALIQSEPIKQSEDDVKIGNTLGVRNREILVQGQVRYFTFYRPHPKDGER